MRFNIDAQPMPAALKAFSEQSRIQLLYRYELVEAVMGNPVHGDLDARDAIKRILQNTGLEAVFTATNVASIELVSSANSTDSSRSKGNEQASMADAAKPCAATASGGTACTRDELHVAVMLPQLEEIIVTARRIEESLSKTPVAITALTGYELRTAGINSVVQLQYLVPGLMVSRGNQGVNLSIRGVTTTDTTTKGEPGISFNTDGIPVNRSEEQALGFFDVQRVEVLSGPQGTLYGKSSTGGAINVVTNQPTQTTEAAATMEIGNYDTRRLDAMINLPLSKVVAMRAAVNANYRDGFIDLWGSEGNNHPNGENDVSARISLLARFSDEASLRVTATAGRIGGVGFGNTGVALDVDDNYRGEGTTFGYANRFKGHVRDHFAKGNVQADVPLGPVHLTYLGSYSRYRTDNLTPAYSYQTDGQRLWVRDTYGTTYQELRFANRERGKLQYVAGINYFYEHVQEAGHLWSTGPASVAALGYDPDYFSIVNLLNSTTHTTYSAYAHANYALTPQWRITAGLREASDRTARQGTFASGPFAGTDANGPIPWLNSAGTVCTGLDDCIGTPNNGAGRSSKLTYNIGTDYQFAPNQMGYLTVATGYKAGGFNDFEPSTNGPQEYGPENITAYEAGYKMRLPSGFQLTSSLYYYDYSQEQITQLLELDNDPDHQVVYTRLAPTIIYGWENSLVYPLTRDDILTLSANFGRAHYARFSVGPTFNIDFSGKTLDRVPATVLSAGFTHGWRLRTGAELQLHAASRYSSSYFVTDLSAAQQYQQEPFTRSDADLTYTSANGNYTTQIFVRNIEDKVQITGGASGYVPGVPYSASGSVSEPRFLGFRQTVKF